MRELAEGLIEIPGVGAAPRLADAHKRDDRDLGYAAGPRLHAKSPRRRARAGALLEPPRDVEPDFGQMKADRGVGAFYQALVG